MRNLFYHSILETTQATPSSRSSITQVQQIVFEQEVKDHVKEKQYHKMNVEEMFNMIHGQCTKEFVVQMRTCLEYELAKDESNVISLVEIICKICH